MNRPGFTPAPGYGQPGPFIPGPTKKERVLTGVLYGVILGLIVICIWWYWAYNTYRWSADRLSGMILSKYEAKYIRDNTKNAKDPVTAQANLLKGKYFKITGTVVDRINMSVTANAELRDKNTQKILSSTSVSYKLYLLDTDCTAFSVTNCLVV